MPNKMERFTQRARRVLSLAQEEAEKFQHNYIGTEHMLLGLMREDGGVAHRVLLDLGLDLKRLEEWVVRLTEAGKRTADLDLAPETKRVLELAVDEARRMGHHYIGTEHLILGLMRQTETAAIKVLKELGVSPEDVRRQVRRVLQESPVQPSPKADEEATHRAARRAASRAAEITERELLLLNVSDLVEIVQGEAVTTTVNRYAHGVLPGNLYAALRAFVKNHDLGYVALDDVIYILLKENDKIIQARIPDLSFIRKARLTDYNSSGIITGAPDFAVEIVSKFTSHQSILAKIRDFLSYGTEEAWVVYLEQQEIHVYKQNDSNTIRVYRAGDMLDSAVLPGLVLPVSDLFKQPE